MRCAKCGVENPAGKKFCGDCGAALANLCPKCGADNPAGKRFCGECGTSLGVPGAAASAKQLNDSPIRLAETPAAENLEGERKTVTALFADIKGSTELEQDLDPEEARAIVDPALKLMIESVHRYDGYIVQSTGDGIFALFGAPLAHEDHPQRALFAALKMQDELHRYASALRERGRPPIEIRVGVNTGEVVVRAIQTADGHNEYTPIGHAANLAARLQVLAPTGSITVGESTRKLCEGFFTFKSLGPTQVKGVTEPVNVFEATGLGPLRTRLQAAARRGLSRFVGRASELEQMKRALASAQAGRGQVLAVVAEPGLGKSRLFYEFQALGHSESLLLETFSTAHGKGSAYLPLVELLRNYFRIGPDDDVRRRREKIAGKVLMLDRALEDTLPYFFTLLEATEDQDPLIQMSPDTKRRRTLDAIKRLLLRESLNQPLIIVFEDLHWVDEGSQALLNLLVESIGTARVLILVNYRPEYSHSWGNKTFYTQLRLDPLGAESSAELLNALLGEGRDLAALKRVVFEKTEGNPFFMEEIVQALFEEGALLRNGAVKLARSLNSIEIPATVQAVLASRIDRLPAEEKDLLNTLAVIGKEFSLELVRETTGKSDDELLRMLANLQAAEFIYEQPALADITYVFKHALSQQVAYGSALQERRKVLHERIGRALESRFPAIAETQPELIAHHFTEAGLANEAIPHWQHAAERAVQRGSNPEAITYVKHGLGLLEKLMQETDRHQQREDNQRQYALFFLLAEAQSNLGEHLEAQATFIRAAKFAQLLQSTELLVRAARELARMASWYGVDAVPAVDFLEDALRTAPTGDQALRIKTLSALGLALAATGQGKEAKETARAAVALARSFADPELLSESLEGALLAFQGPETTDQRLAYASELMQLWHANEKKGAYHDRAYTLASWGLFSCHLELGNMRPFDDELDDWIRYEEKWQERFEISTARAYRAMRALMRGDFAGSERLANEASELGQRLQTQNTSGIFAVQMFTLRREQGRLKELAPVVRYFIQQHGAAAAWRPGLALIYAELGLEPEAREQFEILAQHEFADLPRDALWMGSMTYLADVCVFLADQRRAALLYALLAPFDGRNVVVGNAIACYGALSRYLGALAATLERWDDAERHFEDALAMNTRMEAPPWVAHTQHRYAGMLLRRSRSGDRERALGLLHAAFETAHGLGMGALNERVSAALERTRPHLS
ncbi:MAG TPA: adenylate/guanylate cyclase domain-containing protein [Candidatus Binataceae bacterium]|nr:adenylate/guanylate cyclase domain-containing protein [Candidatus Binataceae bacterium]